MFQCWSKDVKLIFERNGLIYGTHLKSKHLCELLKTSLLNKDISMFHKKCKNTDILKSYSSLFSPFTDHQITTAFLNLNLPFILRKRLTQIRLGSLPLRVVTGRYNKTPLEDRLCQQPLCNNKEIENEVHFLIFCPQYNILRQSLFNKITYPGFIDFSPQNKFRYLLTSTDISRIVGQYIIDSFDLRVNIS